jgi:hypothetical protein
MTTPLLLMSAPPLPPVRQTVLGVPKLAGGSNSSMGAYGVVMLGRKPAARAVVTLAFVSGAALASVAAGGE